MSQKRSSEPEEQSAVAAFRVSNGSLLLDTPLFPRGTDPVRIERVTLTGGEGSVHVVVPRESTDAVQSHLDDHGRARIETRFEGVDGGTMFAVSWPLAPRCFLYHLSEADALVKHADYGPDEWNFEVLFPSYDAVSSFYQGCRSNGVEVTPQNIHEPDDATSAANFEVTPNQRRTLLTALDAGYFDVPRRTDLASLGEELGVSDSAVSQCLRRGVKSLVANGLRQNDCPDER